MIASMIAELEITVVDVEPDEAFYVFSHDEDNPDVGPLFIYYKAPGGMKDDLFAALPPNEEAWLRFLMMGHYWSAVAHTVLADCAGMEAARLFYRTFKDFLRSPEVTQAPEQDFKVTRLRVLQWLWEQEERTRLPVGYVRRGIRPK
jgi:hypothetical protein